MKNVKKTPAKRKSSKPTGSKQFDDVASLVCGINDAIESRMRSPGEEEHLRQIDELGAAYEKLEGGLHPEVVIHALSGRCISLYRQLQTNTDNNYCLILLSSLSNSLDLCLKMYHNEFFYGNITGTQAYEKVR